MTLLRYFTYNGNGNRYPVLSLVLKVFPSRVLLGDSLAVELSALDRATLVRIQVPQP